MRTMPRLFFAVVAALAVSFAGCKKSSENKPKTITPLTPAQVASKTALQFQLLLFSGFGGLNFNGGVVPSSAQLNQICGKSTDTTFNQSLTSGDTVLSIDASLKGGFACANGYISSDYVQASVAVSEKAPGNVIGVNELFNVTVDSTDPSNPYANTKLNGSVKESAHFEFTYGGASLGGDMVFDYTINSAVISGDGSSDVLSGTASFATNGNGVLEIKDAPNVSWNYTGTATFLGSNKVSIVIGGKTFLVNMVTGEIL